MGSHGRHGSENLTREIEGASVIRPCLFFFSSRRRHTRYWRDWSSDVCSSDLVAEEVGLPVMAHLDAPPPSRREVVDRLRPGDILTHCFRPFPNAPVRPDGKVREEIMAARARGVIFDIGHGGGSFGFGTTRGMLAAGFLPDVISSDVHV